MATHFDRANYDAETLASAAENYQRRIGVELLWITDESGVLLAISPGTMQAERSIAEFPPIKEAMQTQEAASAIAEVNGSLFQVVAVPVFGPDVIGFLVLGHIIDDALATRLKEETGSDISFLNTTQVFASSLSTRERPRALPDGERRAELLQASAQKSTLLDLGKERFLSLAMPIDAHGSQPMHALVQGSYDEALKPLHALQLRIAAIGAVALAVALLVGVWLAGGIIRPVRTLVAGMHEVLKGNLKFRSKIEREDEIGFLARSFNEMVGGLEEREHIKDTFGRFVSRDVAAAVLDGRVPLEGERREVSILFQDIRASRA